MVFARRVARRKSQSFSDRALFAVARDLLASWGGWLVLLLLHLAALVHPVQQGLQARVRDGEQVVPHGLGQSQ
jgi:hypothetical protein